MDEEIWRSWERVPQSDSVLVVVGDVAMGDAVCDATWDRIRRTPGRHKHLVIGNHDLTGEGRGESRRVRRRMVGDDKRRRTAARVDPLTRSEKSPKGTSTSHGHEHGKAPQSSPHINVSIEQLDYEPIALTRLRRLARALVAGKYPPGATTIERVATVEQSGE